MRRTVIEEVPQRDQDKLWSRLDPPGPRGCREWSGCTNDDGYGMVKAAGKTVLVHRLAFFLVNGYWPDEVRHTCDNPPCCEPTHLLDGTRSDNIQDMVDRGRSHESQKTHCPQGHPYSGDNLYVDPNGWRKCRECIREASRRRYREARTKCA